MLFDETHRSVAEKGYRNLVPLWRTPQAYRLTTLGVHDELLSGMSRALDGFGLPVETWNVEAGPGQVEINLAPVPALPAADHAFLFKHAVKELAAGRDVYASFIPKLSADGFGNGTHLNFSLWRDGENAFHSPDSETGMSALMRHFVAGLVRTLPDFTLMYAPTINAYRRFVPLFPPDDVSWASDNKSNAIRCVTESPSLTRVEQRTAGGDVNPYLLLAACIGAACTASTTNSNHRRRRSRMRTPMHRSARARDHRRSSGTVRAREVVNNALGEDFVRFYAHSRRIESRCHASAMEGLDDEGVSDWELARYLEMA